MDDLTTFDVMASAMVERGLATSEQVTTERSALEARLASGEGSFDPMAETSPANNTQQTGATNTIDTISAAAFEGPASPASYRFEPPAEGVEHSAEQETAMRTLFHEEGVPVPIASEVGRLYNAALTNPPTAQQLEQSRQSTMATLDRMWGADRDANIAIAQREVHRMAARQPGIVEMLDRSGLGNNPWLITTLVNMARAKGRA